MMKLFKIILLSFSALIVVFAIIITCHTFHAIKRLDFSSKTETISVRIGSDSNVLYLTAKIWGIAGDHEQIVLSKSKDSSPNHIVDYIFYAPEIFYKVENSIIYIYAPYGSISEPIEKIPNVVIKELRLYDEIKDYNNHYSRYGLERISVYQNQSKTCPP